MPDYRYSARGCDLSQRLVHEFMGSIEIRYEFIILDRPLKSRAFRLKQSFRADAVSLDSYVGYQDIFILFLSSSMLVTPVTMMSNE